MRFGSAIGIRDGLAIELVQRRTFEETRAAMLEAGRRPTRWPAIPDRSRSGADQSPPVGHHR